MSTKFYHDMLNSFKDIDYCISVLKIWIFLQFCRGNTLYKYELYLSLSVWNW